MVLVRVTYNEDSNVIMTVSGGASQMRGSAFFRDKLLYPRYKPMDLSRNAACSRIIHGQKQNKLSEKSWAAEQMAA